MTDKPKICAQCKHYRHVDVSFFFGALYTGCALYPDRITGKPTDCSLTRDFDHYCGRKGKQWEPKT